MNYLIDTHIFLWIVTDDPRLTAPAREIYLDPGNTILLSIVSIWEIAIKRSLGKISLDGTLESFIREHVLGSDIGILKLEVKHFYPLESLPFHHRDPFDRLIISQAIQNNLTIVTVDRSFDPYPVPCVR